jgi:glycosyltransferase involved in cell wall biosynthesis
MARVSAEREDVGLWLVGEGPEEPALRRTAHELGIAGRCQFVGKADRPTVARYMNAADLLVLQSVWEGMPTVVVEALACGLPCVTTRVGDVAEAVIDGQTGHLVEPDPDALAEGIGKVLAHEPEHWTEACVRMARRFDWSEIARRITDVYRAVSGTRGPA